ncbi:MAG: WYL domain-containing protein [Flavobacteriales bacterium]|nr:WYL domain-containing protein [Flavobacteriales bacterium]
MPINKHALIRYQALDRCFASRGRECFWEDLLEACNAALYEYTGKDKGISRRQLFEDIKYMESDQGWSIPLERHASGKRIWYRYSDPEFSINKRPLNEDEASKLKEALLTLNRFKGMPQFAWVDELVARLESGFGLKQGAERIIEFEENPYLKGSEHMAALFQAILGKQVLEVNYQGFKQAKPAKLRFHPYYLKQFNNRWFVFGSNEEVDRITNMALDRIQSLKQAKGTYRPNGTVDFAEFFEDVVGVTVPDTPVEQVDIRVSTDLWPYLASKPLHGSQKVIAKAKESITIRLSLKVNYELRSMLLSHGGDLEVISPAHLREAMRDHAKAMVRKHGK